MREPFSRNVSANESSLSLLKQSLRIPLCTSDPQVLAIFPLIFLGQLSGKAVNVCKSSIGIIGCRQSTDHSSSPQKLSDRPSWENEILHEGMISSYRVNLGLSLFPKYLAIANSSLPAVQQALRNQRVGADSRADRMNIWLQNVESMCAQTATLGILFILSFLYSRGRR